VTGVQTCALPIAAAAVAAGRQRSGAQGELNGRRCSRKCQAGWAGGHRPPPTARGTFHCIKGQGARSLHTTHLLHGSAGPGGAARERRRTGRLRAHAKFGSFPLAVSRRTRQNSSRQLGQGAHLQFSGRRGGRAALAAQRAFFLRVADWNPPIPVASTCVLSWPI